MTQERNNWGIPQWENVLKHKGTINPDTIEFAEYRLAQLRQSSGICYDDRVAYAKYQENKQ